MTRKNNLEVAVCVVTHPLGAAGENATRSLLEILSAITTVSLVTADLPTDSVLRERHEVIELTDKGAGDSVLTAGLRFVLNQLRMCQTIAQRDEEVVLFFGATAYLVPIAFARLLGKTVILEPRGNIPVSLYHVWRKNYPTPLAYFVSRLVWLLERSGYRIADGIITLSPSMAEDLNLKKYDDKLHRNGAWHIDLERFSPKVPYEQRNRCIGYVGRLSEEKGVRGLVPIVAALPDDITFVFVGDGELRSWVTTELAGKIETGSVEITGWIDHDQVPEQLSRLQLLVMTSKTEGLPITILEAMACGTPAYVKPVAGIPDIVKPESTGYYLTEETPEESAKQIEAILDDRPNNLSDSCRAFVEEQYSFAAAADRYQTAISAIHR